MALNNFVTPLFTDLYQITMCYSYFKNNKHEQQAVYDLFFRKNPFKGEFTIFAGLEECIKFVSAFKFTDEQIAFLKGQLPDADPAFFVWLKKLDSSKVKLYAIPEGTVVFPRIPLIRVEGPIAICQLIETPLLNLVNFPSLVATNAARHRIVAGSSKSLFEFGCRRAQGPDGAISAARYSYIGGFDGTSLVEAGSLFNLPLQGTHAHAFVSSFVEDEKFVDTTLKRADGSIEEDFMQLALQCRKRLGFENTSKSELLAFAAYARSFPTKCLCLVDTYDTLDSGVKNFLAVALALHRCGYTARGIRLDSGDLAYLSTQARAAFREVGEKHGFPVDEFKIVASNDLNVKTIQSLNQQGHEIDIFGIGTHLVTCQSQPALGCVYKLVEISGIPRIKLSQEISKVTIPGKKAAYRLCGKEGRPIVDMLTLAAEEAPTVGKQILCRHPFAEHKRARVTPTKVIALHELCLENAKRVKPEKPIKEIAAYVQEQLQSIRTDHLRLLNPTPYKVSVSSALYQSLHDLWQTEAPIAEL